MAVCHFSFSNKIVPEAGPSVWEQLLCSTRSWEWMLILQRYQLNRAAKSSLFRSKGLKCVLPSCNLEFNYGNYSYLRCGSLVSLPNSSQWVLLHIAQVGLRRTTEFVWPSCSCYSSVISCFKVLVLKLRKFHVELGNFYC